MQTLCPHCLLQVLFKGKQKKSNKQNRSIFICCLNERFNWRSILYILLADAHSHRRISQCARCAVVAIVALHTAELDYAIAERGSVVWWTDQYDGRRISTIAHRALVAHRFNIKGTFSIGIKSNLFSSIFVIFLFLFFIFLYSAVHRQRQFNVAHTTKWSQSRVRWPKELATTIGQLCDAWSTVSTIGRIHQRTIRSPADNPTKSPKFHFHFLFIVLCCRNRFANALSLSEITVTADAKGTSRRGEIMAVCNDCRGMVHEIMRSARQSSAAAVISETDAMANLDKAPTKAMRNLTLDLSPVYKRWWAQLRPSPLWWSIWTSSNWFRNVFHFQNCMTIIQTTTWPLQNTLVIYRCPL